MNTLNQIIALKKEHVKTCKELYPIKLLEKSIYFNSDIVSLKKYLLRKDKHGIIAEIKKHSPSKGALNPYVDIEKLSIGYMQAGASAISVLTDKPFFNGSNEDLTTARKNNFCPILRKDFTIDEYQIIEAKSIGADAILLIASILTKAEVKRFTNLASNLGLEVILEIHDKSELSKASTNNNIIGINNRNLNTLEINKTNAHKTIKHLVDFEIKIAESGIEDAKTITELKKLGYHGFLIGSYFMKHATPQNICKELIHQLQHIDND